jgi:beta-glucosidase
MVTIRFYQVEGGNTNDWSEWEKKEDRIKQIQKEGKNPVDYMSGKGCDFWNRYDDDFKLAKLLNNNIIRFGFEWSRIQTGKDTWNVEAIKQYRQMLESAKAKGLSTAITLWHWPLPLWIAESGGWDNPETVKHFAAYAEVVTKELGGLVDYWFSMNEPTIHVLNGYLRGNFPPNIRNPFKAWRVFKNLVAGHKAAYEVIHKNYPRAEVSANLMFNYFEPARHWFFPEILLAKIMHYYWNENFIGKIRDHIDFIGAHYYFHDRMVWYPPFRRNLNEKVSDIGWEIFPEGIYHVLKFLKKFGLPIMITEHGIADAEDKYRKEYIIDSLAFVHQAISEGANVIGYMHWSLMDNFEWAQGYTKKFGLYKVDRNTLERVPRPSALAYADICKNNRVVIN